MDRSNWALKSEYLTYHRPPFVRKISDVGYILEEIPGVIIIKGGKIKSAKTIRKPLEGFDVIFEELEAMREELSAEKQAEIDAFALSLDAKYVDKEKRILNALENVSTEEVVEDADPAENLEGVEQ